MRRGHRRAHALARCTLTQLVGDLMNGQYLRLYLVELLDAGASAFPAHGDGLPLSQSSAPSAKHLSARLKCFRGQQILSNALCRPSAPPEEFCPPHPTPRHTTEAAPLTFFAPALSSVFGSSLSYSNVALHFNTNSRPYRTRTPLRLPCGSHYTTSLASSARRERRCPSSRSFTTTARQQAEHG